jgi:hypothetical protein
MPKLEEQRSYSQIKFPDPEARKETQGVFVGALVSSNAGADKGARNALALTFAAWVAVAPIAEPVSRMLTEQESEKRAAAGAAIVLSFVVGSHAALCRGGAMSAYTRAKRLGVHEAVLSAHVAASDLFAPLPYAVLFVQCGLAWLTFYILGFDLGPVGALSMPSLMHLAFLIRARWGRMNQWRQEFELAKIEDAERPPWLRRLLSRRESHGHVMPLSKLKEPTPECHPVRAPELEREPLQ